MIPALLWIMIWMNRLFSLEITKAETVLVGEVTEIHALRRIQAEDHKKKGNNAAMY